MTTEVTTEVVTTIDLLLNDDATLVIGAESTAGEKLDCDGATEG